VQSQPDGIGPQLLRFPDFIAIILQPFHTVHDRVQPKSQSSFESSLLPSIGSDLSKLSLVTNRIPIIKFYSLPEKVLQFDEK